MYSSDTKDQSKYSSSSQNPHAGTPVHQFAKTVVDSSFSLPENSSEALFYHCTFANIHEFISSIVSVTDLLFYRCVFLDAKTFNKLFKNKCIRSVYFINCDLSHVRSMDQMFMGCRNLREVQFIDCDTSELSGIRSMFHECGDLEKIEVVFSWDLGYKTISVKY